MLSDQFDVVGVHNLSDYGQTATSACIFQQQQTFVLHPLERIWGSARFICAAAQQMSARTYDCVGSALDLVAALDRARARNHSEPLAADSSAIDPDHGTFGPHLAACELERVENRHHAVHA